LKRLLRRNDEFENSMMSVSQTVQLSIILLFVLNLHFQCFFPPNIGQIVNNLKKLKKT